MKRNFIKSEQPLEQIVSGECLAQYALTLEASKH